MFSELVEGAIKENRCKIVKVSDISTSKIRDMESYCSLFFYDETIKDHISFSKTITENGKQKYYKGTVSGYKGNYYCRMLWFDIDNKNNKRQAKNSTRKLINRLMTKYQLQRDDIVIYFSGGKGFHVGISSEHFGGFQPSNDLPEKIGRLIERMVDGIDDIDLGIYNGNRLFRLPNSRHAKTKLYKIPLTKSEIDDLDIKKIELLAKQPRTDYTPKLKKLVLRNNELVKAWELASTEPERTETEKEILKDFPEEIDKKFLLAVELTKKNKTYSDGQKNEYVFQLAAWCNDFGIKEDDCLELVFDHILNDFPNVVTDDTKNKEDSIRGVYKRMSSRFGQKKDYIKHRQPEFTSEATRLFLMDKATMLARYSKLRRREILEILRAFNGTKKHQISDNEIYKIVNSVSTKTSERAEDDYGSTMSDMVEPFFHKIMNRNQSAITGIVQIDEIEDYDFEGRLMGVIGKAGTKKSILLKDMLLINAQNGMRGIYSDMEGGKLAQFVRMLNSSFAPIEKQTEDGIKKFSASKHFKYKAINGELEGMKIKVKNKLNELYGDYLILDDKTNMSKEDYREFISKNIKKRGSVNMLGVDGLSMMESFGKEWESAAKNSKELKDLTKEFKMFTPLLIHTPADVSRENRSLFDKTRGGSKVGDNCDIFISLSMILDKENSFFGNDVYHENLVFLSYWGKRTTGKKLDLIMELDTHLLRLNVTDYKISDFDPDSFM